MVTNGFNSCRNITCNFTEGNSCCVVYYGSMIKKDSKMHKVLVSYGSFLLEIEKGFLIIMSIYSVTCFKLYKVSIFPCLYRCHAFISKD
mgnify:CR=1 FL=1